MRTNEKIIYLTFDDGPIPGPTEFVLETLSKHHAKATFFCIGDNIRKHPSIYRRIIQEGHAVGNHTFHHLRGWNVSLETYVDDTQKCADEMKQADQPIGNLFRPPYGRITHKQITALGHYQIVMWDVLTNDFNKNLDEEKCLRKSVGATRSGSIVVFHDSLKAEKNLTYVLPRFLEHFSAAGFKFHALSHG